MPRLTGKADVQLWRSLHRSPTVFGSRRPVFVRARDASARQALRALGVHVPEGAWRPVHLDAAALMVALDAAGVQLRTAPAHRPQLDLSLDEIRVHQVHQGVGLEKSRRGKGVLVGIIDTGVDLTHPAFRTSSGRSRVVAVWDQDAAAGRSPKKFGYGRECKRTDIDGDLCPIGDSTGHGTHVAGIAAGSAALGGVAPAAKIAVVRSDTFTRLADAVIYLTELADDLGVPVVINTSVGGQYGPHDGRTPLESFLSSALGSGRVMVAAAGNDGNDRIHVGAALERDPVRITIDDLPFGKPVEVIVDLWCKRSAEVELALELWDDDGPMVTTPLAAPDSELLDGSISVGGAPVVDVTYGVELDSDHGLVHHSVVLDGGGGSLPPNTWLALRFAGKGRLDGWISQSDYRYGVARFGQSPSPGWIAGDGERAVVVPATSPDVIAVGAYTVRDSWQSEDEREHRLNDSAVGVLALFSSLGPTTAPRHTGMKPDLTAPGSVIASARAATVAPGPMTLDAERLVMQGTSMAAPFVTGTVALMLEADPDLDPERVRDQLSRTARADSFTGTTPNPAWGYGKLDAALAVGVAEEEAVGCVSMRPAQPALLLLLPFWLLVRRRRD